MAPVAADEDLIRVGIVSDKTKVLRHTVLRNHGTRGSRRLFDILGCARCDIVEDQLLCHTAAEAYGDVLHHFASRLEHIIVLRLRHRVARCARTCRDNGDRIDRLHIRQHMEQDRMACLMVCGDPFFFIRNDFTALLRTDAHFDESRLDIGLAHKSSAVLCRHNRCLVQQVLQLCASEACGRLRDLFQIHILGQRFVLCMDFQDFLTAHDIRRSYNHAAVKTARTENRRIQDIDTVRRCHHDDALIDAETIHLNEKLV